MTTDARGQKEVIEDYENVMVDFLLSERIPNLRMIIQDDDKEKNFSVAAEYMPLKDSYPPQMSRLMASPLQFLALGDNAVRRAQNELDKVEKFTENRLGSVKKNVHLRIYGEIGLDREFFTVPKCDELHRLVRFTGTVIRATLPRVIQCTQEFFCRKCHLKFKSDIDPVMKNGITKPTRCPNIEACNGTQFTPLGGSIEEGFDDVMRPEFGKDYQELKIQEQIHRLPVGHFPSSIWVVCFDDLVDSCSAGDDVTVTGVFMQRYDSLNVGTRCGTEFFIMGHAITVNNKQNEHPCDVEEYHKQIRTFWDHHKFAPMEGRDTILASFCPQVYGLYLVKLSVMLVLIGGVRVRGNEETGASKQRGESHLLLVGDPGTGKSQFLKYAAKVMPRSIFTTGVGSTSAGLTASAIKDGAVWTLEAGALVLANGGICCIDEFNSIKECDKTAIHEAMEQQTVSVAKAGLLTTLNSRCSIIAATNPKGMYDPEQSVSVNVAIASPLLSRFDLILVLVDSQNPDWDRVVADYILNQNPRKMRKRNLSAKHVDPAGLWPMAKMRAYISLVKQLQPEMSPEAEEILNAYYVRQRRTDLPGATRTTVRLLESLIRLAQAHARLMFREVVTAQDAVCAVSLMEASMLGGAICGGGINPLHASFPSDPEGQYLTQMKTILGSMNLDDIAVVEARKWEDAKKRRSQQMSNARLTEELQTQVVLINEGRSREGGGGESDEDEASDRRDLADSTLVEKSTEQTVNEAGKTESLLELLGKKDDKRPGEDHSRRGVDGNKTIDGISPIIARQRSRVAESTTLDQPESSQMIEESEVRAQKQAFTPGVENSSNDAKGKGKGKRKLTSNLKGNAATGGNTSTPVKATVADPSLLDGLAKFAFKSRDSVPKLKLPNCTNQSVSDVVGDAVSKKSGKGLYAEEFKTPEPRRNKPKRKFDSPSGNDESESDSDFSGPPSKRSSGDDASAGSNSLTSRVTNANVAETAADEASKKTPEDSSGKTASTAGSRTLSAGFVSKLKQFAFVDKDENENEELEKGTADSEGPSAVAKATVSSQLKRMTPSSQSFFADVFGGGNNLDDTDLDLDF